MAKKNLYGTLVAIVMLSACSAPEGIGELVGAGSRGKITERTPYGMVLIPSGHIRVGGGSDDEFGLNDAPIANISIDAFYMDETEVTNSEYRQFVNYIIEYMKRDLLAKKVEGYAIEKGEDEPVEEGEEPQIDWRKKIDMRNEDVRAALEELNLKKEDRLFGVTGIDVRLLSYTIKKIDYQRAAKYSKRFKYSGDMAGKYDDGAAGISRGEFWNQEKVYIYPDTLVWISDFTYSFNEPFAQNYFSHPTYGNHPVVGVTWRQAKAFCAWRTEFKNNALRRYGEPIVNDYKLPSEAEWEFAARGGQENAPYPWGGPYTRYIRGCFFANFKPARGNYAEDGHGTIAPVAYYAPNDFGLYDMAGNVAEWTRDAYNISSVRYKHDKNSNFEYNAKPDDPPSMKKKVIKGGSWNSFKYFLQIGKRWYEYQDSSRSFIGFRCLRYAMAEGQVNPEIGLVRDR